MRRITQTSFEEFLFDRGADRSGILPYCRKDEKEVWLMGLGRGKENFYLSDFGGGCEIIGGFLETPLQCCVRKVDEESSGQLTEPILISLQDEIGLEIYKIESKLQKTYLLRVEIPYADYSSNFQANEEILSLVWIDGDDILSQLSKPEKIHNQIFDFLDWFL